MPSTVAGQHAPICAHSVPAQRRSTLGRAEQCARATSNAEELAIELAKQLVARAVAQALDERAPDRADGRCGRLAARGECPQVSVQRLASSCVGLDEHWRPQRPCLAEQRRQRTAQLLASEGLVLEQGELPTVERLGERGVRIGSAQLKQQFARY